LADETTDISTKEQMSLTVRHIDDDDILHEDFLQFYEIESLTGSDLASSILNGECFYITLPMLIFICLYLYVLLLF